MSDNRSGKPTSGLPAQEGYGSGGNRCTEACNSMIAWQWDLGAVVSQWKSPEEVMYAMTEQRNGGSDVSRPRNGQEVVDWVNKWGPAKGVHMGNVDAPQGFSMTSFESIVAMINRGHVGMAGFGDYNKLRKVNGKSPYSWKDPDGDGHVLMVVGYCISRKSVFVNDSLLGDKYQPAEYSYQSFVNAKYDYLGEVFAPPLPGAPANAGGSTVGVPSGWKDDGKVLTAPNGHKVQGGFREYVLGHNWNKDNYPMEDEHAYWPADSSNPSKGNGNGQVFKWTKLCWVSGKGVWEGSLGSDLVAERASESKSAAQLKADQDQIASMNAEINDLKKQLMSKTPADVVAAINSLHSSAQSLVASIESILKEVA